MSAISSSPAWTNPKSDRVKALRRLADRTARRSVGQFLVEGPQAVREALGQPKRLVRQLLSTAAAQQRYPRELALARAQGLRPIIINDLVLAALSDTQQPQGLLAVCDLIDQPVADVLAQACAQPHPRLAILAQARDPGNAGTIVRAADATGVGGVLVTAGSVDVHNPKCVRSTAGSLFHLPLAQEVDLPSAVTALRERGVCVLAADVAGAESLDDLLDEAVDNPQAVLRRPTAWIFGNEARGLADAELELADAAVRVPLYGRAESLNVAMAAMVCLQASARVHTAAARRDARHRSSSR